MTLDLMTSISEVVFKASVVAWFFMLSRRVAKLTRGSSSSPDLPGAGPYRTPSPRDQAVATPTSIDDSLRAIDDAIAKLNERLRNGKISAYEYGGEIEWLGIAARKAGDLKKRMRGNG